VEDARMAFNQHMEQSMPLWSALVAARDTLSGFKRDFRAKHIDNLHLPKTRTQMDKVKTTNTYEPETDYEIRRLAKRWKMPIV
jgi:hypothetical protein